jgi:hypothetical protein
MGDTRAGRQEGHLLVISQLDEMIARTRLELSDHVYVPE